MLGDTRHQAGRGWKFPGGSRQLSGHIKLDFQANTLVRSGTSRTNMPRDWRFHEFQEITTSTSFLYDFDLPKYDQKRTILKG